MRLPQYCALATNASSRGPSIVSPSRCDAEVRRAIPGEAFQRDPEVSECARNGRGTRSVTYASYPAPATLMNQRRVGLRL